MKMKFVIVAIFVCFMIIGCQTTNIKKVNKITILQEEAIKTEIIIPSTENIEQIKKSTIHLVYGNLKRRIKRNYRSSGYYISGYQVDDLGNTLQVSKLKGFSYENKDKVGRITYSVTKSVMKKGDNIIITLVPKTMERDIPFDIMQSTYEPEDFTLQELASLLKKAIFHIKLDMNTKYSVDSTASNFKRLARPVYQYQPPAKEITGNITRQRYQVNGEKGSYIVGLEVFPYRNGSKAIIDSWITPIDLGNNTVSLSPVIDDLVSAVKIIIND